MIGYMNDPVISTEVILEQDSRGRHKTEDKGHLDEDGFLTIVDRYSHFLKIGSEMIRHGAIKVSISALLPEDTEILATTLPGEKKGEKVVPLFSDNIVLDKLKKMTHSSSHNPLMKPAALSVEVISKLGSGNSDFTQAKEIALEAMG